MREKSKYIDHLILSSDCNSIEIAKNYKVDVPFKRPKNLSGDTVPSADVIEHAITFLKKQDLEFGIIVLIEPTSLRTSEDIDNALKNDEDKFNFNRQKISKVEDQHPDFCFLLKNEKLKNYAKRNFKVKRRQDIEDIFFLEGSVYASFIDSFLKKNLLSIRHCSLYSSKMEII